jgi:hypothetical protein
MTDVSKKNSRASRIKRFYIQKRCSPKSQVPTGGRRCIPLRATSSHQAGITSSHEGKAPGVQQDVLVYVIGRNILAVLLNRGHFVLLSDDAPCILGVIATMQLYFTAEEQLEILIRRPTVLSETGFPSDTVLIKCAPH